MAELFEQSNLKAKASATPEDCRRQRNAAAVHDLATKGLFHSPVSKTSSSKSVEDMLCGPALATRSECRSDAQTLNSEDDLHPLVVALRSSYRLPPQAMRVLSLIVYGFERTKGEELSFSNDQLGMTLGLTAIEAGETINVLQCAGLIAPRVNSLGGRGGFCPTLPRT